ncbi:hypothetical protein Plhal304r1_c008g0033391 [Plasmopara halstedii]
MSSTLTAILTPTNRHIIGGDVSCSHSHRSKLSGFQQNVTFFGCIRCNALCWKKRQMMLIIHALKSTIYLDTIK